MPRRQGSGKRSTVKTGKAAEIARAQKKGDDALLGGAFALGAFVLGGAGAVVQSTEKSARESERARIRRIVSARYTRAPNVVQDILDEIDRS